MSQSPKPAEDNSEEEKIREDEEAHDRARGRAQGPGTAPKTDEIAVPRADDAPTAPADEG